MDIVLKYKQIECDQLIKESDGWWMLIRYITVDPLMEEKIGKELALVRVQLIKEDTGKPYGECTKLYSEIEKCLK